MSESSPPDPSQQVKQALGLGAATAALPWLAAPAVRLIRLICGPGDAATLIWWPETSWYAAVPLGVGAVLGVIVAILFGLYGKAAFGPMRIMLCGLVAVIAVAAVLSWPTGLRVYGDRVEWVEARFPDPDQHLSIPLEQAISITAYCRATYKRHGIDKAFLAYEIYVPEIGAMDLADGRMTGKTGLRRKLELLTRLDAGPLKGVPATNYGDQDAACMQRLRARYGKANFATALALMRIDERTYLRQYVTPDEAWAGKAH
ncbi:MAG: hypothetical protein EBR82_02305 [Caulobacteraceae bacterium]|nr:hypothetical protein [Caulobacteraceae bacterium]